MGELVRASVFLDDSSLASIRYVMSRQWRAVRSLRLMKTKSRGAKADELRPEYDPAGILKDGVQGKHAARYRERTNLVLLAPNVAASFPADRAVNEALRLVSRLKKIPSSVKEAAARS